MVRAIHAILNPLAGGGRAARVWADVERRLAEAGARVEAAPTAGPHDGERLARIAAASGAWDVVAAVGGDGTVNAVAAGLVAAAGAAGLDPPALGIVPAGSGNDLARTLGLAPGNPVAAADALLAGPVRRIDYGVVNGRVFVNGMGWGLDGRVAEVVAGAAARGGRLMYIRALLAALRDYRPAHVDLTVDGRTVPGFVTLVAVTSGPCFGGGFRVCPHARVDDGLLDLCVADAMPVRSILALVPRVRRGTHLGHRRVWYARGTSIRLVSREPRPAHVDGEVFDAAATRLEVAVAPGGLRVVGTGA